MSRPGRLVTFEGGEGAGKTTQIERLARQLEKHGLDVTRSREPGGTEGGEAIRALLVEGEAERWTPLGEALLHTAARAEHVARLVRPALAAGSWVLLDRFADSTRVYQGIAGRLGLDVVDRLQTLATSDLEPDLTLLLDLPVTIGLGRAAARHGAGRYEAMGSAFHERVRQGFLALADRAPRRFRVIDASEPVDAVAARVLAAVREHFPDELAAGP
jgi:dTMP kinase